MNEPPSSRSQLPLLPSILAGDFVGPDLADHPERFVVELSRAERGALHVAAEAIASHRFDAMAGERVDSALADVTARTRSMLSGGDGVVLLRGVPTEGFDRDTLATLFTRMGALLGRPASQNLDGEVVTDVRDTGADPGDPNVRLYRTRAEQDFHTDGADVIGLLCLHPAEFGGLSRVVSSVRVFRRVMETRPDLAARLFDPWFFHLPGGPERGLPAAIPRPIVSFDGEKLETFFIGWYIRNAEGLAGVPPMDDGARELLALYEATANDPSLYLDMEFRPGDVQWLRNSFVLHKRTEYVDPAPPAPKRHLLRLWLNAPYIDDATPRFEGNGVRG